MTAAPVLEARELSKTYATRGVVTQALSGVDLSIAEGEFTALAGPSGSGKTTLLNLLGALDEPSSGEVVLDGQRLSSLSPRARADLRLRKLGFVFQAYNLIPVFSARENVAFVLQLQKVPLAERHRRADALLEEVGLGDLGDKRPLEMSGGQQQRVAVARAIASQPRVVLADEPTANLDSETARHLLGLMERLNRDRGVSFLFSTHDPLVMEMARRLIRLKDGRIASDEPKTKE
ncbi:MAG: ABC transporter ATP-binding protein [Myxococcota bacterium]